ncbi:MAG: 4-alpha-glucanotransferase [Lachnospiraceae bacterium]|nr:4-alpha-glucanotransferase [Lachnospiraceae bacterium]
MRSSGILMPIFSLPSKYGIGGLTKEAYDFVDFLSDAKQKYWQILPLGPTGYGDSPYQSFSTFAGNPYFIDLDELVKDGLLTEDECARYDASGDDEYIDYERVYFNRFDLLRIAYERSNIRNNNLFCEFIHDNAYWLDDYALFMAVKREFGGKAWIEWDKDIRVRTPEALERYKRELWDEIDFFKFQQYYFSKQWKALKHYANDKGIEIVGDIPIYVAFDSSDAWSHPELFELDNENIPIKVAGCPPDPFAITGQLWGNPLYEWEYHKNTGYDWWVKRIGYCFDLYDVVRIDHFRGFDEYYAIPYGDPTAENGEWKKGPGYDFFATINEKLGAKKIIAEDLGFLTDSVRDLVKQTGYPGMKVLHFAFDSSPHSEYLPHMIGHNSVIYTGTHDNETSRGWYLRNCEEDKRTAKYFDDYTGNDFVDTAAMAMIRLAMSSVADTCIIMMQDYLNLGNEARINKPSTLGNNWGWRMEKDALDPLLAEEIANLTYVYGRC